MTTPFAIRQAVAADAEAFRALRLEALQAHPEAFGSDYESESKLSMADWVHRVAGRPLATTFLAEAMAQPIGMCALNGAERVKLRHSATIGGVFVRPEWRGRGVAQALVAAAVSLARERGFMLVKLAVITGNARAIRVYERAGFRGYGVEPCVIRLNDVCYDELLMALRL